MGINIAIDGPAGAGKSTIAKLLAKELGFIYVDTGAMYRAIALYLVRNGVDIKDEAKVVENCSYDELSIRLESTPQGQKIYLFDEDVSEAIREESIGLATSTVSAYPHVRSGLTELQKKMARENNVIMDGRDIGTVVLPNADLKVFLTASSAARAKRRYDQLIQKGETPDMDKIKADIELRDHQDSTRAVAPLKQAKDAVLIDSSDMTISEVVCKIKKLYESHN